jgi:DNA polymerase (family 10)
MRNAEIAEAFDELASLYELDGAIVHRVVAYRNAAKAIRDSGASVEEMTRAGRVQELAGVGKTIEEKIVALLDDDEIPAAVKLKDRIPAGLVAVTGIPGLGPKRARKLYDELGVESLDDLRAAAESGRLSEVGGFGAKAQEKVLAALDAGADGKPKPRVLLSRALEVAEELVEALRSHPAATRVEVAGSTRRMADTVKDLDIVAAGDAPELVKAFSALPVLDEVSTGGGEAGARAMTHHGLGVDLRIVPAENFGNLLQHFTGSGRHNEALRTAAVRNGFHVSEYGVLEDATGETHLCQTEQEVYRLLGMDYIEPELRENRGELEAARDGELPDLITEADIRGDLHSHTVASDGRDTVKGMVAGARERGYEYLAITDHSASHGFGNDVQPAELRRQVERIRKIDAELDGFTLLAGSEVNVLPDGSLDYDDDLLAELDWVVASLHTSFQLSESEMTDRMVAAIEHPLVDAIGHPTGRMLGRREPYRLDIDRVVAAAAENGTFLEINANPNRRDLNDSHARLAAEHGVKLVIDSDAHGADTLEKLSFGVATARRAWLTKDDVANTMTWKQLAKKRKTARAR